MDKRSAYLALPGIMLVVFSCKNISSQNHGPIVLGDSSLIVTETDPQRLQDMVTDLKPNITPAAERPDTPVSAPAPATTASVAATPAKTPEQPKAQAPAPARTQTPLTGSGLKADFGVTAMLIPNVTAKQAGNPNLTHANGAVYTWQTGNINNNLLKVSGNVTKVSQRYQTIVIVKNELGVLPLESLSTTTDWESLKGQGGVYRIAGLDERSLEYPDANRNSIRNAVSRSAKRHRMSRRRVQDWENSVRNVRAANQKPLHVVLRSVMWKIDGKDPNGRPFSKQIRIDMPL